MAHPQSDASAPIADPTPVAEPTPAVPGGGVGGTRVDVAGEPGERTFRFDTGSATRTVIERPGRPVLQSGSALFDGLFALALDEVRELSVSNIHAHAFDHGRPVKIEAFETGELWQYVWTRDLAYAVDLGLAGLDVPRCVSSLVYKTSDLKPGVDGENTTQILQDTGTGGSYPVSTDRVVWALAAERVRHFMDAGEQDGWVRRALPVLRDTIAQDRVLVFDPVTGLYRGEQSFLDWREQTYPTRTADNVLAVATSEALSTNVTHYVLLTTAADWSAEAGDADAAGRYRRWADALKAAINERLWDEAAGLYGGYLLVEETSPVRVHRYDLLGQCLAILTGVAGPERAHRVLNAYPTGPFGPAVVWPQESTVPIYHNHAIWPFVTAYWAKAARFAGHDAAVAAAVDSLARGTARHLSNMENLDFRSGHTDGHSHGLSGPKINSRRQLWSVAGYVGVVRDVLLGMETTERGVRFRPCLPAATRRAFFAGTDTLRLGGIDYRGKRLSVVVRLPADAGDLPLTTAAVELNGRPIGDGFTAADDLPDDSTWVITMTPADRPAGTVPLFTDFANPRALFGPPTPAWRPIGQDGIDARDGLLTLHYEPVGDRAVAYDVYRDGRCVAHGVSAAEWTDPDSADHRTVVREYAVEAVYPDTGTHSYPSAVRWWAPPVEADGGVPRKPAAVVCGPDAIELSIDLPAGTHVLRLRYANGNGAINTGLTCAVKRAEVLNGAGQPLAAGYLTLPQTGGAYTFQVSSPLTVTITTGGRHRVRVGEDAFCRNMSYFRHNSVYTGHEGGGPSPCNTVRVEAVVARPARL